MTVRTADVQRAAGPSGDSRRPGPLTGEVARWPWSGDPALLLVCLSIAATPLLTPVGPGNTGPVDALMAAAVAVVVAGAVRARRPLRVPLAAGMTLYVLAGALSGLLSRAAGGTVLDLAQDVFVLGWCTAVVYTARTPARLNLILGTWSWAAIGWAALLDVAVPLHLNAITGFTYDEGTRAALTFGDPNRAGAYFCLSFFVVAASGRPHHRLLHLAGQAAVLFATALTGSNAALLGIAVGLTVRWLVPAIHRFGGRPVAVLAAVGVLALGALATRIDLSALARSASGGGQLIANTVGRSSQGAEDRGTLAGENLRSFFDGSAWGVGPGQAKAQLAERQSAYVKEAHNDYLATLIERGALGLLGLFVVALVLLRYCRILVRRTAKAVVACPAAIVGGLVAISVSGAFHEVLHWRQVWTFLAILTAAALLTQARIPSQPILRRPA